MTEPAMLQAFTRDVLRYYDISGRHDLPWRQLTGGALDPYAVLVSEIMLQQTQVPRVIPKYLAFMAAFPTVYDLAAASLADVVRLWSGLGYNRRAKFLWQAAGYIVHDHAGRVPDTRDALVNLPGIGPNTAGAILAYAYNQPQAYIETNIRSVYIHHFFPGADKIADSELLPLIEASIPDGRARDWYWALMDYGTFIKQTVGNTAKASKTYAKQSAFHGSRRKIRGQVIKLLSIDTHDLAGLQREIADDRLSDVLDDLITEGFIGKHDGQYSLKA